MKTLSVDVYIQFPACTLFCIQHVVWVILSTKSYVNVCFLINCCRATRFVMFQDSARYQFLWTTYTITPNSGTTLAR